MKPGNWPGRAPGSMRAANRAGERCVAVEPIVEECVYAKREKVAMFGVAGDR